MKQNRLYRAKRFLRYTYPIIFSKAFPHRRETTNYNIVLMRYSFDRSGIATKQWFGSEKFYALEFTIRSQEEQLNYQYLTGKPFTPKDCKVLETDH